MQRQGTHLGGSSSVTLISSSKCVARTGLHNGRLGYNGLDTLKARRDGLIKVRCSNQLAGGQIIRIPLDFPLDLQFLSLQIPCGISSGEDI